MNIKKKNFNKNKISLKIVSIYVIFGVLWISLSDRLLNYLISDINTFNMLQTFKGIIFVIITSILLYSTIINVVNSLVKTHNNLVISEAFYSIFFNNNHLPFLIIDPSNGNIANANKAALNFYKYSYEEIIQMKISEINILSNNKIKSKMNSALNENTKYFEFKHRISTCEIKDVEVYSGPINIDGKSYLYSLIIDATEKNISKSELHESNEKFNLFANYLEAGLFIKDFNGKYIFANKFTSSILGENDLANKYFEDYMSEIETLETIKYDKKALKEGKISYEQSFTDANGNKRIFKCLKFPIYIENKETLIGGINFDVTDYKLAEKEIKKLAFTDILTGLNNLNYLNEKFNEAVNNAVDKIAILFVKINKIKEPCEILGQTFEKNLLTEISNRIKEIIKDNDAIILFSKYEFLLQITDSISEKSINELCKEISHAISKPFILDSYEISLTSNIGISNYPNDSLNLDQLINNARMAIANIDNSLDNCVDFYTNKIERQVNTQFQLQNELSKAIYNKELTLAYQPIINTYSEKVIKVEALLRWKNSHFGQVPPSTFIPIAEKSNSILKLGEWVLRKACLQIRDWVVSGKTPLTITINISARQLEQKDFIKIVRNVLLQTEVDPKYLEFEITESMALNDAENTLKKLKAINDMGIRILMDDFGTGYSSLAQLKKLPVDTIKIDRSFINDLNENMDSNSLVSAIISMAKSLDLKVIAEGVETPEQLEYLRKKNCDMIQGYLISKPLYIQDLTILLKSNLKLYKKNQI